ncbi:MAG: O-antigen ligase family protein [Spirochaetota bacterium]|nr:O-antigen ligase family protein [Spirochaetota bacterium]
MEKRFEVNKNIFLMILFFLIPAFISFIRSDDPIRAIQSFLDAYILTFMLFYISVHFFNKDYDITRMLIIFWIIGIVISTMGIIEYFTYYDLFPNVVGLRGTDFFVRANGPFPTSEEYGLFLSLCILIILAIKHIKKTRLYSFEFVALILIFCGILCSMNRTIIIVFIMSLLIPLLYYRKSRYITLITVLFIVIIAFQIYPMISDVELFRDRVSRFDTIATRFSAYYCAIAIIKDHYFMGIGLNNFQIYSYFTKYNKSYDGYSHPKWAHNTLLQVLSEMGLITLIPFCIIIVAIYITIYKYMKLSVDKNIFIISISICYAIPFLFTINPIGTASLNYLYIIILAFIYSSLYKTQNSKLC